MKNKQKVKNTKTPKDQSIGICDVQDNSLGILSSGRNHMQILFKLHMMNAKLLRGGK